MVPSQFVTYKVAKKLFDLNVISRATFLSFVKEFAKVMKGLRKEATITVDWDAVRDMFDFDDYADVVPINAANLCSSLHAVQEYVNQMGIDMNKDVSIQKRTSVFATIIDDARALIAQQLNISTAELAFMRNATEANNIINNGLDFNAGEEVVIWSENHGTNNRAWAIRQQRNPNINIITWTSQEQRRTKRWSIDLWRESNLELPVWWLSVRYVKLFWNCWRLAQLVERVIVKWRCRGFDPRGWANNLAGVQTPQASNNPGS